MKRLIDYSFGLLITLTIPLLTSCPDDPNTVSRNQDLLKRGYLAEGINGMVTPPGYANCQPQIDLPGYAPLNYTAERRPAQTAGQAAIEELINAPNEAPPLRRSRGLLEFPTAEESAAVGACQSRHYNPDGNNVDQYIAPHTGCAFASVLQEWNEICPGSDSACRLNWGDISHKTQPLFNGHRSHTGGECIDLRPIRKQGEGPLTFNDRDDYDREKTQQLIDLLRAKGGSGILFNDPNISGASYWDNHDNHIHVCFRNSNGTRNACEAFQPDYNRCPMLYNLLESPEVRSVRAGFQGRRGQ